MAMTCRPAAEERQVARLARLEPAGARGGTAVAGDRRSAWAANTPAAPRTAGAPPGSTVLPQVVPVVVQQPAAGRLDVAAQPVGTGVSVSRRDARWSAASTGPRKDATLRCGAVASEERTVRVPERTAALLKPYPPPRGGRLASARSGLPASRLPRAVPHRLMRPLARRRRARDRRARVLPRRWRLAPRRTLPRRVRVLSQAAQPPLPAASALRLARRRPPAPAREAAARAV